MPTQYAGGVSDHLQFFLQFTMQNSSKSLIQQKTGTADATKTADCFKNEDSVPLSAGHELKKFKKGTKMLAGTPVFTSVQATNWGCSLALTNASLLFSTPQKTTSNSGAKFYSCLL